VTPTRVLAPLLTLAGLATCAVSIAGMVGSWGETRSQAAANASVTPASTSATAPASAGATAPAATSNAPAAQTPADFLAALGRATRDGDVAFLLGHLQSGVITVYGRGQCAAHLRGLPAISFVVKRVHPPASYVWTSDNASITVSNAIAVDVTYISQGSRTPTSVHVVPTGTSFAWFTDCGTPRK
jgi:hypothetical protein